MDKMLEGLKILVTRPEQQAENLCKSIEALGGKAIRFPVIEIKPGENQQAAKTILDNINQYDIGIFVSRNAVDWTVKLLGDKQSSLDSLGLIAIGSATAEALGHISSRHVITNSGINSEALLELDELSPDAVSAKKIVIFRGQGGREYLAATLRERGAEVDYAEVYRRDCPQYSVDVIDKLWRSNAPDAVVVTSNNGLKNLFALLNEEQRNLLSSKQLVVTGRRISDFSMEYDFVKPSVVAEENGDEGILKAIVKWAGSLN